MQQKSCGCGTPFPGRNCQETQIKKSCPQCVERMKSDTAATGIKDRIGHKMVQINEHRPKHNKSRFPPMVLPDQLCDGKWHNQVKRVMNKMSDDVNITFHGLSVSLLMAVLLAAPPLYCVNHP